MSRNSKGAGTASLARLGCRGALTKLTSKSKAAGPISIVPSTKKERPSMFCFAPSETSPRPRRSSDGLSGAKDGYRRCGSPKLLEAEHRTKPQLDRSVILLNQIVEVFGLENSVCTIDTSAHRVDDDLPVEMAAFEKIINVQHAWPGSSRANLPPNMRHTNASHQNPGEFRQIEERLIKDVRFVRTRMWHRSNCSSQAGPRRGSRSVDENAI